MKSLLLVPVLFGLFAVPVPDQKQEDEAIGKRHDEWCAAWNAHDAKRMAGFFLADADLINPFGRQARGNAAIEKLFAEEQAGPMAGTTYAGTIENIRYIGKDVAIIDVAGVVTGMKGADGKEIPPTNKPFDVDFCTVARWDDGQIVEENLFYDLVTFMKQIGLGK